MRRLDALLPLTMVCGLPGTGKTTLLASWALSRRHLGDDVAWIGAADTLPSAVRPSRIGAAAQTRRRLIVIVDDAHHLGEGGTVRELVELLARHDRLHLVIAARARQPFERIAARRNIVHTVIGGRELCATAQEVPDLAAAWGHPLTRAVGGALLERTGGWLAPMRAALDDADPESDPNGIRAARRFVREHVLDGVRDESLRAAAARLALAREFTFSVARAALEGAAQGAGPGDALAPRGLLDRLERHGLIDPVSLSDGGAAWRIPRLLAEILVESAAVESPETVRRTHGRIAVALHAGADPRHTARIMRHARAAERWTLLDELWRVRGLELAIDDDPEALSAYTGIPAAVLREFPALAVASSVSSALRLDDDPTRGPQELRSYAEAGWAPQLVWDREWEHPARDTMAITSRIIAHRIAGNAAVATSLAEHHDARLAAETDGAAVPAVTRAWFELQWAIAAAADLDWTGGIQLLERAMHTARAAGAPFILSAAAAQRALMHAVAGDTVDARSDLETHRRVDTSRWRMRATLTGPARLAEAVLCLDRLDPAAAEHLEGLGDGAGSTEEWALVLWARARHAQLFGDPVTALAETSRITALRLRALRPDSRDQHALDRTFADLALALGELNRADAQLRALDPHRLTLAVPRARLALIAGRFPEACAMTSAVAWAPHLSARDRVDLSFIGAAASLGMGDDQEAAHSFLRGHVLSAASGILAPYAHLSSATREELLRLSRLTLPAETRAVIEGCRAVYPERGELVRLTARERTILHAIAEYETLADVADALTVSINTVKKQVAAIYAKLDVHDRAAALVEAYRLGLVPDGPLIEAARPADAAFAKVRSRGDPSAPQPGGVAAV